MKKPIITNNEVEITDGEREKKKHTKQKNKLIIYVIYGSVAIDLWADLYI